MTVDQGRTVSFEASLIGQLEDFTRRSKLGSLRTVRCELDRMLTIARTALSGSPGNLDFCLLAIQERKVRLLLEQNGEPTLADELDRLFLTAVHESGQSIQ